MYRRRNRAGLWMQFSHAEKHIPLGTDDEAAAAEIFAARVRERAGLQSAPPGTRPLAEIFDACAERAYINHTKKTAREDDLNLARVLTWLELRGILTASAIDSVTVDAYKKHRQTHSDRDPEKGVSTARINRELTSWKKAMAIAVEDGHAAPVCLSWFKRLREPRPIPHQIKRSKRELTAFLSAARRLRPEHWKLFRTVLGSAIRDDEARHMSADDIVREGSRRAPVHWLVVTPKAPGECECCPKGWATKGYRYRRIPISAETARAARAFVEAKRRGLIGMGNPKGIWNIIQECATEAGIPPISLHPLRHAWATQMLEAGHKLNQISQWLGHADVQTTMRYLGVSETEAPRPDSLPW
jgi:integrase